MRAHFANAGAAWSAGRWPAVPPAASRHVLREHGPARGRRNGRRAAGATRAPGHARAPRATTSRHRRSGALAHLRDAVGSRRQRGAPAAGRPFRRLPAGTFSASRGRPAAGGTAGEPPALQERTAHARAPRATASRHRRSGALEHLRARGDCTEVYNFFTMPRRSDITVRQYALGEEPEYDPYTMALSPGERIEMVWQITKSTWAFKEPSFRESRLRRDVARVIRRGR